MCHEIKTLAPQARTHLTIHKCRVIARVRKYTQGCFASCLVPRYFVQVPVLQV